jgi:hypothetical protein
VILELTIIGGIIAWLKKPAVDPTQNIQTSQIAGTNGRVMQVAPKQPVIDNQRPSSGHGVETWRPNAPINKKRDSANAPTWGRGKRCSPSIDKTNNAVNVAHALGVVNSGRGVS